MTEMAFYTDSYTKELETKVTCVNGTSLELESTLFYPLGGGQPGDSGWVVTESGERHLITDARKGSKPGAILHLLENETHGISLGDHVTIGIDWQRRYAHMRMHTAMHLLGSLIPVPVTGGSVGAEKSRLDFDVGDLTFDKGELTTQMNDLIDAGHDVIFESITESELDDNPGLVRTMSVQPPRGVGDIRMVRIQEVDFQPCGGTHINNTTEIGPVRISKIENKGKKNRRFHLVFGS